MSVAVITLSRTPSYLERLTACLESQHEPCPRRRILVDNVADGHLAALARARGWQVVKPGHNTGFAEGNNLAVRELAHSGSLPDWLLLLNDDLRLPDPDWLGRLWLRRSEAPVLGCLLLHEDGSVNHAGVAVDADGRTDHLGRAAAAADWIGPAAPAVPAVTFSAVLVATPLWAELGGLDEGYWYGWEDTDFCLRALCAGHSVRVARDAVAVHEEFGTRPPGGATRRNQRRFQQCWRGRLGPLLRAYGARHPDAEGIPRHAVARSDRARQGWGHGAI